VKLLVKLKRFFRNLLSLNFYFTVFTVAETVVSLGIARLIAGAFGIDLNDSPFTYFFLCAVCVAAGLAVLINSFFLKPIENLSESMKKVSGYRPIRSAQMSVLKNPDRSARQLS
jgi:hypothetical protein